MAFMLLAMALLTGMDAVVKVMVLTGVHAITILAWRGLIVVPAMIGFHLLRGEAAVLRPKRPVALVARGVSGFLAPLCFFMALQYVPLSNAMLVGFSSAFVISILSMLWLRERIGRHRWTAIAIGYVGVAIVILPSVDATDGAFTGYGFALGAAVAYAVLFVSGRQLSTVESTSMLVLSFNVVSCVLAWSLMSSFGTAIGTVEASLIVVVAILALAGHLCFTRAFTLAEGSLLAPLEYTAVVFALFYDAVFFDHIPSATTWVGALVILGSGLYVAHRERVTLAATPGCEGVRTSE